MKKHFCEATSYGEIKIMITKNVKRRWCLTKLWKVLLLRQQCADLRTVWPICGQQCTSECMTDLRTMHQWVCWYVLWIKKKEEKKNSSQICRQYQSDMWQLKQRNWLICGQLYLICGQLCLICGQLCLRYANNSSMKRADLRTEQHH